MIKSSTRKLILILFFFSGLAGLSYQVVWIKLLSQIFGHTIYAVSSVVAAFMGGLALGSYVWGRLAGTFSSPLRLYAALELGIGLYALSFIFLFPLFDQFYIAVFHFLNLNYSSLSITRILFSLLVLILPTFLMGGTFPVLCKFYIQHASEIGTSTAVLYGLNTAGAVIGAGLAGFLLIEKFGITCTTLLMVLVNFTIALVFFVLSREPQAVPINASAEIPEHKEGMKAILILYAISGFAAMALEVLWTRELTIVFLSSTYSFTAVVATFLVGLAIGSLWISKLKVSAQNAARLFYQIEYGIALSTLVALPLLRYLPQTLYIQAVSAQTISWGSEIFFNFIASFAVILVPTFLMGAAFPVVCSLYAGSSRRISVVVGEVYAYNTVGSIAGTLVAGFILIPVWGVFHSIILMSGLSFVISFIVVLYFRQYQNRKVQTGWQFIFAAVYLLPALFFIGRGDGFRPLPADTAVLFSREDVSAEVKVLKHSTGTVSLYINEKQQGGTQVRQSERWTGQIPLIFHPHPDTILVIGLGSGVTLNAISEGGARSITCVDLIGSLREAARYFSDINGDVLNKSDRVKFIVADGINYLNLVEQNYDLILCDIVHPDDVGAGGLYAREFYTSCRARLQPGGFLAQWLILDQLSSHDLQTILYTFLSVFPEMQIYLGHETSQFQKLLLIGSAQMITVDPVLISNRLDTAVFSGELPGQNDAFSFLSYYIADGHTLRQKNGEVPLNTFDHPLIEYSSPRSKWLPVKTVKNLQYLAGLRRPLSRTIKKDSSSVEKLQEYFHTRTLVLEGRCQELSRQYEKSGYYYTQAALSDIDTLLVSKLLTGLALTLAEQNKTTEAENTLRNALAVNNRNVDAAFALAELFNMTQRSEEAIPFYKYTVDLDSTNYVAYRKLGDLFSQKREFENAFYAYSMSVQIESVQPVVHYILGQLYLNYKKNVTQAEQCFQKSLEIDPNHRYREQAIQMLKRIREQD
jgi:spermidine synthase